MHLKPLVLIATVSATAVVAAQNAAFEVTSVKPQIGVQRGASHSGVRYDEPSAILRRVIEFAYDLPSVQVVGGPEWIQSDLWAIDGRAAEPVGADEMRSMVRQLLIDRFKLAARFESRELPIYELHLARQDGKLGPNAKPAAGDCTPMGDRPREAFRAAGAKACGPSNRILGAGFVSKGFRSVPISALATYLESELKRVVKDHTGVKGPLDLELTYAAETGLPLPSLAVLARQPDAPPLFTALREQLGLKLEASRGPVDVLVIDSVERPSPD